MIIIGERINCTRKGIREAVEKRDEKFIQTEAINQAIAGANFLDVNSGGHPGREISDMEWLVKVVRSVIDTPLCIDIADSVAIETGLKLHGSGKPIINSVTNEEKRIKEILPLVKKYNTYIVALTLEEGGVPTGSDRRVEIAKELINKILDYGIPLSDIFIDPCVFPLSTDSTQAIAVSDAIRGIREEFQQIKFTCGLSNISYGLPHRPLINQTFLTLLLSAGLDAALIDPLDKRMMAVLLATEALLNKDEYCMQYLTAYKEGKIT